MAQQNEADGRGNRKINSADAEISRIIRESYERAGKLTSNEEQEKLVEDYAKKEGILFGDNQL